MNWPGIKVYDALHWQSGRGMWRYSRQLIRHMQRAGLPVRHSLLGKWHARNHVLQLIGAELLEPLHRAFSRPHIALYPYSVLPFLASGAQALVIHDLIFMDKAMGASWAARYRRGAIERSVKKAQTTICPSETSRQAIRRRWPDTSCVLIPPAVDEAFAGEPATVVRPDTFTILHFGGRHASKGTTLLIEAVAGLVSNGRQLHLKIAAMSQQPRFIWETARRCGLSAAHYSILPRLSDAELAATYQSSDLLCMPSLAEGFGIPVIEAASQGVPSLLSPLPVFREVMSDAALYFDRWSAASLETALTDAMQQDLMSLGRRAKVRAAEYSFATIHERYARPVFQTLWQQFHRQHSRDGIAAPVH